MPNKNTDNRDSMALINAMRNMSQFVVVVLVADEYSETLANYFFQHGLMKFGLCYLVVLDDDTSFKDTFVAMCKVLKLNYDILAKRNHTGLSVEHFHRFLNKAATIAMADRQSNNVFVPAEIITGYVWNNAPIDGTAILHSTVAIGREFRFPIDIDLSTLPQLTQNNAQSAVDFYN